MTDVIQQNATDNRLIPIVYFQIFTLRLVGFRYEEIASRVGYTAQYIRLLFSKGHILNELWLDWVKDAKANCVDEALTIMIGNLPDITRARVQHAKGNDPGAVVSSKIIFEYVLGRPDDARKQRLNNNPQTFADWVIEQSREEQLKNEESSNYDKK